MLLSDAPRARVAQMQTLDDMMRDVEADEVFQAVARNSIVPIHDFAHREIRSTSFKHRKQLSVNYSFFRDHCYNDDYFSREKSPSLT